MTAVIIGGIMFVFVFGGALGGMYLRKALPAHHLTAESRDLIKLGVGLIATMSALIIGFLIASAKGSYDTQRNEILQLSGEVVVLDRIGRAESCATGDGRKTQRLIQHAMTKVEVDAGELSVQAFQVIHERRLLRVRVLELPLIVLQKPDNVVLRVLA